MKEQIYEIEDIKEFELSHIFECGQCFRWEKEDDGSYTGVIKSGVLNVRKENGKIIFHGIFDGSIKDIVNDYFDFDTDYKKIKDTLSKVDINLKKSIEYGYGIRILHQDLEETIISFIISANNNIPRIKGIINRMSKKCGKKIDFLGKEYYLFPEISELSKLSVKDLRELGLGFRDKRIYDTIRKILNKEIDLENLKKIDDTDLVREELLKLDGVGPKVADCIMLFSLKKYDVFPIDVWVRRVMNELYIKNEDETKVSKNAIDKLSKEKFGALRGLAQQYLFYFRREN